MVIQENVILTRTLEGIGSGRFTGCLAHALCTAGSATIHFNGRDYTMREGDLMIVRKGKLIEGFDVSADFAVRVMYATPEFIALSNPQSNYGTKGQLALFLNPVMTLTPEQYKLCCDDFDMLERRIADTGHHFRDEIISSIVRTLILDFFYFHSSNYSEDTTSTQNANLMNGFIEMLESGVYRSHREVSYYADHLCVTPKYLSEVSKRVSGFAANYWINRYTILDISRLLRDKSLTFARIADIFGFSSAAYFSRYVQKHLGVNPKEYRER